MNDLELGLAIANLLAKRFGNSVEGSRRAAILTLNMMAEAGLGHGLKTADFVAAVRRMNPPFDQARIIPWDALENHRNDNGGRN